MQVVLHVNVIVTVLLLAIAVLMPVLLAAVAPKAMVKVAQIIVNVLLAIAQMESVVTVLVLALAAPVTYQKVIRELVIVIIRVMIPKVNVMVQEPAEEPVMVLAAVSIRVLQLPAVAYKIAIT
ncbi:MAG: hypothetical protein COV41_02480 [Candidatus Brennerbacteria bacterium CG11_big_fil_rev_8_21_14_0_20_43_10]|uniref:Uncharacterized protein n=1 Tax=Candidatus Brennerbacteria bacterium CG11_big_fil_rev_8_21_14_0_20_43_10 TaxID=1974523 RepID=A0A2H0PV94_9BACT|nr:MAG: hypothetical protein COV41_02480 [Candidatus Brennerbacteria bacterium CG11_big_fil_rev_8_21_14_0_20_43_10]